MCRTRNCSNDSVPGTDLCPSCEEGWRKRLAAEKPFVNRIDDPLEVGFQFDSSEKFFEGKTLHDLAFDNHGGRQYLVKVANTYEDSGFADQKRNVRAIKAWIALKVIRKDGVLAVDDMPLAVCPAVMSYVAKNFSEAKDEAGLNRLWRWFHKATDLRGALWSDYDKFIAWLIGRGS